MKLALTSIATFLLVLIAILLLRIQSYTGSVATSSERVSHRNDSTQCVSFEDSTVGVLHVELARTTSISPQSTISPDTLTRQNQISHKTGFTGSAVDSESTGYEALLRLFDLNKAARTWSPDSIHQTRNGVTYGSRASELQTFDDGENEQHSPLYDFVPMSLRRFLPLRLLNDFDRDLDLTVTQKMKIGVLAAQGARELMALRATHNAGVVPYSTLPELEIFVSQYRHKLEYILDHDQQVAFDRFLRSHRTEMTTIAQRLFREL